MSGAPGERQVTVRLDDYLSFLHYKLTGDAVAGWSAPAAPLPPGSAPRLARATGAGLRIDS